MNIYIWRDNEQFGPFSRAEILSCLLRGELSNDALARTEIDGEWRSLREVLQATAPPLDSTGGITDPPVAPDLVETLPDSRSPEEIGEAIGFDETAANEESVVPLEASEGRDDLGGVLIWRNNEVFGPYTWDDVFMGLSGGELTNEDRARREGEEEWHSLGEVVKTETGMIFPSMEEIPGGPEVIATVLPRRPLLDFSNRWTVLTVGMVGLLLGFAATCFILKGRQAPLSTITLQQTTETAIANPHPAVAAKPVRAVAQAAPGIASLGAAKPPAMKNENVAKAEEPAASPAALQAASPALLASKNPPAAPSKVDPKQNASPAPQKPLAKARQIKVPGTLRGDSINLWVADTVKKPRAVLVLSLGISSPDSVVRNQVWQEFASENQLALAAVSFSSTKKLLKDGGSYLQVDQGSGDLLLTGLRQAFGEILPIIPYGQGVGGTYVANFAAWQPKQLLMWAAYTSNWPAKPTILDGAVPGLIACDQEDTKGIAQAKQFFTDGRLEDKPWTWVPLCTTWKGRGGQIDNLVKDYVAGALSINTAISTTDGIWGDIGLRRAMSSAERLAKPQLSSWSPNSQTYQKWLELMSALDASAPPIIIEKSIATKSPSQPILKFYLRLPPGMSDGSGVSGVLAYCTWENDEAAIVSRLSSDPNGKPGAAAALVLPFLQFAEKHNLAVLTWGTQDAWNNDVSTEEMERVKQKEFDHNFDLLANAWARGVGDLGRETGIPQKDFLLYGLSRGAQWAHRLALRKPDYFLAVHVHVPSTFDKPTPEASKPLWLVTTGEQEYGYERAQRFYHECSDLGYPIIFKAIVGLGHSDCMLEHALGFQFFEYALSIKNARNAWLAALKDPLDNQKGKPAAEDKWLDQFHTPPYYGDFLNQECYPANQIDMIPAALRVPLPTKELADLWNK